MADMLVLFMQALLILILCLLILAVGYRVRVRVVFKRRMPKPILYTKTVDAL